MPIKVDYLFAGSSGPRKAPLKFREKALPVAKQDRLKSLGCRPLDVTLVIINEDDRLRLNSERSSNVSEQARVILTLTDVIGIEYLIEFLKEIVLVIQLVKPIGLIAED